jgi:glycine oxidase
MNHNTPSYDALIVGGGVIGLSIAVRAAQAGVHACVIERGVPAGGATGVAAGMLAPVGEASWGEDSLLELGRTSLQMWPRFASDVEALAGISAGFRATGALHVALDRDEAEELGRRHELQRRLGLESERLRPSGCRELEPGLSTAVTAGVYVPGDSAADPEQLSTSLVGALRAAGAELITGTEVVGAEASDGGWELRLADKRRLAGEQLVVATGAWAGSGAWLPDEMRPPVRPVKGEILTLRGPADAPACEHIVAGDRIYLVPRDDGRLIAGATVEERGFDTAIAAGGVLELLREAYRVLPEIAELEFVEARVGLRPGTPDNAPVIGHDASGRAILATGHYRNGILLAPVTAGAVAALLAGKSPPVELAPFSPTRFDRDRTRTAEAEVGAR